MKQLSSVFLFLLLFVASSASARLNVSVTNNPQIYTILDQLTAFGLIDDYLVGQRPLSESEILRLAQEAQDNMQRLKGKETEPRAMILLKQIEEFLPEDNRDAPFQVDPLQHFSLQYLYLDSPYRFAPPVIATFHKIDALINPFVAYNGGRPYQDGQNFVFETEHNIHISPYFDMSGQPQFFMEHPSFGTQDVMQWNFDHLYLRSEFRNIGLQIGRDQLVWGDAPEGGGIFSTNARGIDMIKISNIHPFKLPWIFKYLGKMDATFMVGDLGGDYNFPYTYLTAYKLSFLPVKNFQWSFTYALEAGGFGSPSTSVGSRIVDSALGYIPNLLGGSHPIDNFASNRIGAFEFNLQIPKWRYSQIYWEFTLDDANFNQLRFVNESVNRAGIFIPRLTPDGRYSLRLEYKNSGWFAYRHEQWVSGWTHHRLLLGDAIGPDAQGAYVRFSYNPTIYWQHFLNLAWEQYSTDNYSYPPQDCSCGSHRITTLPKENRFRGVTGIKWKERDDFEISFDVGYEYVSQFNFTPGINFNNFLTNLKLTWYPEEKSKTPLPKNQSSDS